MPTESPGFWSKHPVLATILAVILAFMVLGLVIASLKLLVPILLLLGLIAVIRALYTGSCEFKSASESRRMTQL